MNRSDSRPDGQRILISIGSEEKSLPYVAALREVGVPAERITVLIPGEAERDDLHALAAQAGGLVLAGGADVEPTRYGETVLPNAGVEPVPERDAMEWELLAGAREGRVPVWGVCRGLQVINVFLGGSLWQDIPSQRPTARDSMHEVVDPLDALAHPAQVLDEASALGRLLAQDTLLVNSRHHQAIKALGRGLTAVAAAPDGLIEACELNAAEGGWWLRAVQWHPENLLALARQRALWADFAQAASGLGATAGSAS